jgi:hypothetical protein
MHNQYKTYDDLPAIDSFFSIFQSPHYFQAPRSWFYVMTDIKNSTQAIEAGKYKEVNTAGSIAAMAISNIKTDMNFPFLFGGDGMTYLIPKDLVEPVKAVLADTRALVKDVFNLELRVGLVPVAELYRRKAQLIVAKVRVSDSYYQALLSGSGCDLAESLIKDPNPTNPWIIPDDWPVTKRADYSGFTCRWNDIPSTKGETISLIVKARSTRFKTQREILSQVLSHIEGTVGNQQEYHPLNRQGLAVSLKEGYREQRVMARKQKGVLYTMYGLMLAMMIPMMKVIIMFQIPMKAQGMEIRKIKENFMLNADFQKFDGSLKMVLSLAPNQTDLLESKLEGLRQQGKIHYGIHRSNRALMTCLMHLKSGNEVHFIDAADGGYALAAKAMKLQFLQQE